MAHMPLLLRETAILICFEIELTIGDIKWWSVLLAGF